MKNDYWIKGDVVFCGLILIFALITRFWKG